MSRHRIYSVALAENMIAFLSRFTVAVVLKGQSFQRIHLLA